MKVTLSLLLLLISFLITMSEATPIEVNNNGSLTNIDPTKLSYKFAVSWPLGFCKINTCTQKPADLPKIFTIHGLWPNYNGQCTDSTEQYDFNKLASIYGDLKTYWPNIKSSMRPEKFWGDEWKKHGVKCNLFTVKEYFDEALRLYGQVKTGLNLLTQEPLKTTVDSIRSLRAFQGKKPFVLCKEVSVGSQKINYLEELRFCLNGNKAFIDCEPQASQNQYCSKQFKYSATLLESWLGMADDQENFMQGGVVA